MKNLFNHDVFLIDLTKVKNTMIEDLLRDNDLTDKVSAETLLNFKKEGYIKLWVDKNTTEIIAYTYQNNKDIIINSAYISFLKSVKPISVKKAEPTTEIKNNESYTIDSILDKISLKGIESLSSKELKFLKDNSGKI